MYTKSQSKNLALKVQYLLGDSYFPFGKRGEQYEIIKIEHRLKERELSFADRQAEEKLDPGNKLYESGKNWDVIVKLKGKDGCEKETTIHPILKQKKITINYDFL